MPASCESTSVNPARALWSWVRSAGAMSLNDRNPSPSRYWSMMPSTPWNAASRSGHVVGCDLRQRGPQDVDDLLRSIDVRPDGEQVGAGVSVFLARHLGLGDLLDERTGTLGHRVCVDWQGRQTRHEVIRIGKQAVRESVRGPPRHHQPTGSARCGGTLSRRGRRRSPKSSTRKSMARSRSGNSSAIGSMVSHGTRVWAYSARAVSRSPALRAATKVATRAAPSVACART